MLSVVVLGGEAQAATAYGDKGQTGDFSLQGSGNDGEGIPLEVGIGVTCKWQAWWSTGNTTGATNRIDYVWSCSTGWNVSDAVVDFEARSADGSRVQNLAFHKQLDGMDGASQTGFVAQNPWPVATLCWSGTIKAHTGGSSNVSGCTPFAVLPPAEAPPGGSCDWGEVAMPRLGAVVARVYSGTSNGTDGRKQQIENVTVAVAPTVAGKTWNIYVVVVPYTGTTFGTDVTTWSPPPTDSLVDRTWGRQPSASSTITAANNVLGADSYWLSAGTAETGGANLPAGVSATVGGYTSLSPIATSAATMPVQGGKIVGVGLVAVGHTGQISGNGITNPGGCQFYWGAKYQNRAADSYDEPVAPLAGPGQDPGGPSTTPPTVDSTPPAAPGGGECTGFSLFDPSSWAGAGICVLVKAIGALAQTIKDILDFLKNLGQLFETLLVPDPSSWGIDGLKAQLEAKPPFSVLAALGSGVTAAATAYSDSGNGCGVLAGFGQIVPGGSATQITCTAIKSGSGYAGLYTLVELGLFLMTGLGVFVLLAGAIRKGEG